MTDPVLAAAQAGIERDCPVCGAEPGAFCTSQKDGGTRKSTHRDRKPKGDEQ